MFRARGDGKFSFFLSFLPFFFLPYLHWKYSSVTVRKMRFRGGFGEEEVETGFSQYVCFFAVKIIEEFHYLHGIPDDLRTISSHIGCNLCSVNVDIVSCLLRNDQLELFSGYPVWCSGCFPKSWWIWGDWFQKCTP